MILVTGASGQLGRLVIDQLLASTSPSELIAAVRSPEKVSDLAVKGVQVRKADYNDPATLNDAFSGVDKVLLISSSEVGQRTPQHKNVIDAAKAAGVKLIAYTSLVNADTSPLGLSTEHKETEALLKDSGVPYVLLRNGWYTENYTAGIPMVLDHGAVIGCAGEGVISSAPRADYAAAAAKVLLAEDQAGKVYELAGDAGYTLAEFAAEIANQSGREIAFQNLSEAEYAGVLEGAGLPDFLAAMLAESETGASKGGLHSNSKDLSQLLGRATTPLANVVRATISQLS